MNEISPENNKPAANEGSGKSIMELEQDKEQLETAVATLTEALEKTKKENPSDFALFKEINGKLTANKAILEQVREEIKMKYADEDLKKMNLG